MLSTAIAILPCVMQQYNGLEQRVEFGQTRRCLRDETGRHSPCERSACKFPSASTDRRPQEGKVAAVVGAENFLRIELGIAALGFDLRGLDRRGARFQFDLFDQEVDTTFLYRKADAVAAADEAEGAAGRRIRGHMQHYGPERGAAHPCVRDSDHILDPS